jgi:hypothetical protein
VSEEQPSLDALVHVCCHLKILVGLGELEDEVGITRLSLSDGLIQAHLHGEDKQPQKQN